MKKLQENSDASDAAAAITDSSQGLDDFLPDDLYTLKALFLELEKVLFHLSLFLPLICLIFVAHFSFH